MGNMVPTAADEAFEIESPPGCSAGRRGKKRSPKVKAACVTSVIAFASAVASASPVLQFDINQFGTQARNSSNVNAPFGGLTHTGSVAFSFVPAVSELVGIFIQTTPGGGFNNAN